MKFLVGANGQGFCHTVGLNEPEDSANANLIAAAPELLEALRDAVAALGGIRMDAVPESVRAAITKAEGQ